MRAEPDSVKGSIPAQARFDRTDWLSFGVTATTALAIYLVTLVPEVAFGFSGIFSTASMYGGVPHPPGYPLWTIWAWVFTKLSISNIAWRTALATATAGAAACGVIALMVSRGGDLVVKLNQQLMVKNQRWLRVICGCSAGLVFGVSGAF